MRPVSVAAAGVVIAVLFWPGYGHADVEAEVSVEGGRYYLSAHAHIDAEADAVRALLYDYEGAARLSASIQESTVLSAGVPTRVRLVYRACVTFVCRTVVQVQDIREIGGGALEGHTVPDVSDFAWGESRWWVEADNGGSRLAVESALEPAFWVPPVIGPWLVRRALVAEIRDVVANLERHAGEVSPP